MNKEVTPGLPGRGGQCFTACMRSTQRATSACESSSSRIAIGPRRRADADANQFAALGCRRCGLTCAPCAPGLPAHAQFGSAAVMTIPLDLAASSVCSRSSTGAWGPSRASCTCRDTVRRGAARARGCRQACRCVRALSILTWPSSERRWRSTRPVASRLHDMVCERGYAGQASHFRYLVSTMRPQAEAYLRLRTLPGNIYNVTGPISITCRSAVRGARSWASDGPELLGASFWLLPQCPDGQLLRGHIQAFDALGGPSERSSMTILKASCSNAWAMRFAAIEFWPLPNTTASSHVRWPWHAGRVG